MKRRVLHLGLMAGLLGGSLAAAPEPPRRPLSARGASASTLLVYAERRTAYSMGDAVASLSLHLQRVATALQTVPLTEVTADQLAAADYLVVLSPQAGPVVPTGFLQLIAAARQPVLWVGFGLEQLQELEPFQGCFQGSAYPAGLPGATVKYRERTWPAAVHPWIPVHLTADSPAKVLLSLEEPGQDPPVWRPLSWQSGSFTFFAAVPVGELIGLLFADLILDYYGVEKTSPSHLFLRLDDYSARSDHRQFRRMADYLHSRGIPFLVGVIPTVRDPPSGEVLDLDTQPEFVAALRYAQQRGGRLVLHGYTHAYRDEPGEGHEFWDVEQDRPVAEDSPEYTRGRLSRAVAQMLSQGLLPLAWQTPHYAASRQAYIEIARVFSTAIERVQLSDSTHLEQGVAAGLTVDGYSRLLVPENLGYVLGPGAQDPYAGIRAAAERLLALRGTVAGVYLHAYQSLPKLIGLVETLEPFQVPFLDLVDLDNVVAVPGRVLLTGAARRTVPLRHATVRWKAFDRSGRLIAQEQEPTPVTGLRTFERRGVGAVELFEFVEVGLEQP